jgi:Flp pilus assembly protein TadD
MDANEQASRLVNEAWQNTKTWEANYAQARTLLEAALEKEPEHKTILTNLGAVLSDLGFHAEAATHLHYAIKLGSEDKNTCFNLAVALMNCGKKAQAMRAFKKADTLSPAPDTWQAYFDPHGT